MKKINNKSHTTVNLLKNRGSLNIIFLLIIVAIIYLFFNYNVESLVKNKQFDNIRYIKTSISQFINNNESKIKIDFFKTNGISGTNKSGIINLNNFLPQINNLGIQNQGLNNINNNPINNYPNNNDEINQLR